MKENVSGCFFLNTVYNLRESFWCWFDVNRSTFHEDNARKRLLHFVPSDLLTSNLLPQLLMSPPRLKCLRLTGQRDGQSVTLIVRSPIVRAA